MDVFSIILAFVLTISPTTDNFSLISRSVTQVQGTWVVDYRFRYAGKTGIIIAPQDLRLTIESLVSNSRVPDHEVPRRSFLKIVNKDPADVNRTKSTVVGEDPEERKCYEHLTMYVCDEKRPRNIIAPTPPSSIPPADMLLELKGIDTWHLLPPQAAVNPPAMPVNDPLSIAPGSIIKVQLVFEHKHCIYGDYDLLLGTRNLKLSIRSFVFDDYIPMDVEQYLAYPIYNCPTPPPDRLDKRRFKSAPDSIHICTEEQGHNYYRFQELPVRYNCKMRLQFWYLIAVGTDGRCVVHIGQTKDTPCAWRQLQDESIEDQLKVVGRWTKYERIIQTASEATKLILEFKIMAKANADLDDDPLGEMWIDDVSLEPLGHKPKGGP